MLNGLCCLALTLPSLQRNEQYHRGACACLSVDSCIYAQKRSSQGHADVAMRACQILISSTLPERLQLSGKPVSSSTFGDACCPDPRIAQHVLFGHLT